MGETMSNKAFDRLAGLWAMSERELAALVNLAATHKADAFDGDDDEDDCPPCQMVGTVAIVPVIGRLTKYPTWFGGTSTAALNSLISAKLADAGCTAVILAIDSPGGQVAGINDLAATIAGAKKPVVAVVSDMCASGAYWLASQCDSIIANEAAFVGSIGVYEVLYDTSAMYADAGVKATIVKAGDRKGIGADGVAISDEDIASEQKLINGIYALFTDAVATGRGDKLKKAMSDIATGEVFLAKDAKAFGLIDRVGDMNAALAPLMKGNFMSYANTASADANASPLATTANAAPAAEKEIAAPTVPAVDVAAITSKAKAEGYDAAKADFAAILAACGGRHVLAAEQFVAGADTSKALAAYNKVLEAELAATRKGLPTAPEGHGGTVATTGTTPAADSPEAAKAGWEKEWAENAGNVRGRFAEMKDLFIATREREAKTGKKIV